MDKQIVKVPRLASGVVKRDVTGKVVKKSRNAKIVKETTWLLQNSVRYGSKKRIFKRLKLKNAFLTTRQNN
jgi:hypothetical protein